MQQQFSVLQADAELRIVLEKFAPENVGFLPVVEQDGTLVGIVEAHDLLKVEPANHHLRMRELARQDYVRAYPGEMVDRVNREMLRKNVESVVVFESPQSQKAIGIVRANDILQLRRWFIEEETREPRNPHAKFSGRAVPS